MLEQIGQLIKPIIPTIPNLRDAGGYVTRDGGCVRTGLLYRSEQLSKITDADLPLLVALGLKKIYDLRTTDERAAQPDRVPAGVQDVVVDVLADEKQASAALLTLCGVSAEDVMRDYLHSNDTILPEYQAMIDQFTGSGFEQDILLSVLGVRPEYLEASFKEMHDQFGSIKDYFATGLGIDAGGQQALRDRFVEKS
jgi:protein tyrosine/serine phosphatase